MATKWQVLAVSSISIATLLFGLFTLAGMSVSDDGNKACIDCYSEIKVNATYWQVNVENAGAFKDAVFRKSSAHVLYVNLDKIDEIASTDPKIHIDILVPTTKAYATINHPKYGYLRPIKSGDSLIKRNSKSNPNPSRIILHGQKEAWQTVKWSFKIEDALIQDIDIDPVWEAISEYEFELIEKCEYDFWQEPIYITAINNITTTICSDFPMNKTCT